MNPDVSDFLKDGPEKKNSAENPKRKGKPEILSQRILYTGGKNEKIDG